MCAYKKVMLLSVVLATLCLIQHGDAFPSIGHYGKRFGKSLNL